MIPGYAEALAWEARTREEAFLGLAIPIRGVAVRPLCLRALLYLLQARSVFLTGAERPPAPEDVALFLWVVSPAFRPGDADAQATFLAGLVAGEHAGVLDEPWEAAAEIADFLDAAFNDSPASCDDPRAGGRLPVTSFAAALVDAVADAYPGWTLEVILETPLAVLYQLLRRVALRRDPKSVFMSRRSLKVRGDYLRALAAQAADDEAALALAAAAAGAHPATVPAITATP